MSIALRVNELDLELTFNSGQTFLWRRMGDWWVGPLGNSAVKLRREGDRLICKAIPPLEPSHLERFLRLDDDLEAIFQELGGDELVRRCRRELKGLRLLKLDPWECLLSFICSTNSSIEGIASRLLKLSQRFGSSVSLNGAVLHLPPSAQALAAASLEEIRGCGLGYRASFVSRVARLLSKGPSWDGLQALGYEEARAFLLGRDGNSKRFPGIGPKVADCFLLLGLGRLEAFPIDRWMARCILRHYPHLLGDEEALGLKRVVEGGGSLSPSLYSKLSRRMRSYFGRYAGYAEQYLFVHSRLQGLKGREGRRASALRPPHSPHEGSSSSYPP